MKEILQQLCIFAHFAHLLTEKNCAATASLAIYFDKP